MPTLFRDRSDAGRQLAKDLEVLLGVRPQPAPLVLALPRGGVPVAREIARAFGSPLDVLVARKIGIPGQPEVGIGAIAGEDPPLFDQRALAMLDITAEELAPDVARERTELHRREALYRRGRPAPDLAGRTVILVDDGLATGVTARAALRLIRARGPDRLVLAVPVGAAGAASELSHEVDHLLCLHRPHDFRAVGLWYEDFDQVTDQEVIDCLEQQQSVSGTA
ncbi:phosphoribosyltransferase family protein [Streptomyces sp. RerS4]|uniref:phosphoribosyltransferase n=1 Tax=Streptomyces sp. RerS4 TaxID=2942449 RepID=UPI00201BCE02|nr:phosphoribosyltransferase family protein [Streptomyces sp. RerS4]UQX04533.1 phosphoribosyltransferase [Streptomyces sp. RerS4]